MGEQEQAVLIPGYEMPRRYTEEYKKPLVTYYEGLGNGSYSIVHRANQQKYKKEKREVAAKITLCCNTEYSMNIALEEIRILKKIANGDGAPGKVNIIRYIGSDMEDIEVFDPEENKLSGFRVDLYMEYIDGESLEKSSSIEDMPVQVPTICISSQKE